MDREEVNARAVHRAVANILILLHRHCGPGRTDIARTIRRLASRGEEIETEAGLIACMKCFRPGGLYDELEERVVRRCVTELCHYLPSIRVQVGEAVFAHTAEEETRLNRLADDIVFQKRIFDAFMRLSPRLKAILAIAQDLECIDWPHADEFGQDLRHLFDVMEVGPARSDPELQELLRLYDFIAWALNPVPDDEFDREILERASRQ